MNLLAKLLTAFTFMETAIAIFRYSTFKTVLSFVLFVHFKPITVELIFWVADYYFSLE